MSTQPVTSAWLEEDHDWVIVQTNGKSGDFERSICVTCRAVRWQPYGYDRTHILYSLTPPVGLNAWSYIDPGCLWKDTLIDPCTCLVKEYGL